MEIILLSDLHLVWDPPASRLDDVVETEFYKLEHILQFAVKRKIRVILQAGDFFDVRRSWFLLPRIVGLLKQYQEKGVQVFGIMGQHDSYYHDVANQSTNMGILFRSGLVHRLNEYAYNFVEKGEKNIVQVVGFSWGENVLHAVREPGHVKIMVVHKQIIDKKIWKGQKDYISAPEFLSTYEGYDVILCGDAHRRFVHYDGKRVICNTGPMMRLEASEEMISHDPGFYVLDTETRKLEWSYLGAQKGDKVLSREQIQAKQHRDILFSEFTERLSDQSGLAQSLSFNRNLALWFKRNKTSERVRKILSDAQAELEKRNG